MLLFTNTEIAFKNKTDAELKKAYRLFRMMNSNFLVNIGPKLVNCALKMRLPIKKWIKDTIFKHFVGGESLTDAQNTIQKLYQYNVKTILDYSVEGTKDDAGFEKTKQEIIDSLHFAKGRKEILFGVVKITGIGAEHVLEHYTPQDDKYRSDFEKIRHRLIEICETSKKVQVPIFIDAEHSWYQNNIDRLAEEMMATYNKEKPLIYTTLQMYRWDRLEYLKKQYEVAQKKGYIFAAKLVRGAYMEIENERALKNGYLSPIQKTKQDTDKDYNLALSFCIEHIDGIAVCVATHNEESNSLAAALIEKYNLPHDHPHICFSQLFGMSDHISYNLANEGYTTAKYLPYGPVEAVLPYLFRRAKENTSVAGQSSREFELIKQELKRRKAS
ncbi:MAG: proline dehydrogenase family protein [Bacteroidia bacterium]|nr:proline dehydrogenase family protein [Bacteroidia bacterium]MDW8347411.1 proline dehydrogenase family protein [Bacteroidia bacterium]